VLSLHSLCYRFGFIQAAQRCLQVEALIMKYAYGMQQLQSVLVLVTFIDRLRHLHSIPKEIYWLLPLGIRWNFFSGPTFVCFCLNDIGEGHE
jgi:hypothetical protein